MGEFVRGRNGLASEFRANVLHLQLNVVARLVNECRMEFRCRITNDYI